MATVTAGFGETAHVRRSVVKWVIMGQIVTFVRFIVFVIVVYTAKNATDLMQVVNFTQPDVSCQQVVSSLLTSYQVAPSL